MMSKLVRLMLGAVLGALCAASSAAIVTYTDRSIFNSQGSIAENSNFNDFGAGYHFPGDPYTRGHVTYTSTKNLIIGAGSAYSIGASQNVIANDWWTPITGTISGQFDLFGFDLAVTSGLINISLNTNLASYSFNGLSVPNGSPDFAFEGFKLATAGEYFTGFRIDSSGQGYLGGITNVALGNAGDQAGDVPEPGTMALLGLGLLGFGLARRRKQ